jgi:hypothetical protein
MKLELSSQVHPSMSSCYEFRPIRRFWLCGRTRHVEWNVRSRRNLWRTTCLCSSCDRSKSSFDLCSTSTHKLKLFFFCLTCIIDHIVNLKLLCRCQVILLSKGAAGTKLGGDKKNGRSVRVRDEFSRVDLCLLYCGGKSYLRIVHWRRRAYCWRRGYMLLSVGIGEPGSLKGFSLHFPHSRWIGTCRQRSQCFASVGGGVCGLQITENPVPLGWFCRCTFWSSEVVLVAG